MCGWKIHFLPQKKTGGPFDEFFPKEKIPCLFWFSGLFSDTYLYINGRWFFFLSMPLEKKKLALILPLSPPTSVKSTRDPPLKICMDFLKISMIYPLLKNFFFFFSTMSCENWSEVPPEKKFFMDSNFFFRIFFFFCPLTFQCNLSGIPSTG